MDRFPKFNFNHIEKNWGSQYLKVTTGSYCSFAEMNSNSQHYHNQGHEVCYVISGCGKYQHGENEYDLKPGDIFLSDPNVVHEISSHQTKDLLIVFFVFFPRSLDDPDLETYESLLIHKFIESHQVHVPAQDHISHYLSLLQHQDRNSELNDSRAKCNLLALALDCLAIFSNFNLSSSDNKQKKVYSHSLSLAMSYITKHSNKSIQVSEIAKFSHCSERHLRRLFNEYFGHSVLEEINKQKILEASKLLLMNYPVAKVAREIGIDNHSQFSRLFKSILKVTPKQYQKEHLVKVESIRAYPSN